MSLATVNISFNKELLKQIDRVAKEEVRTRSELIREASRMYLERKKKWENLFSYGKKVALENGISQKDIFDEIKVQRRKKMKIVLDMNVFVSAFYFEGNPKLVLERVIEGIDETYVSKGMNEEIFSVMIRPKFKTDIEYVEHFIKSIEDISIGVRTKEKLKGVSEDIKDGKILECALEAKAEYIVTGDKDLLSLESFKNIKISSPENYLKIVNKE